jgi:hypothetical protein
VTGEMTTGYTFFGPFKGLAAARQWAIDNLKDSTVYRVHDIHRVKE